MGNVPSRAAARIVAGLRRFQPILGSARTRDVNEPDTVVIVTDVLNDVFGYDKYAEITREYAIRGTFCDLAIKLDGSLACLVEVKAVGLELKDAFIKQAVDYAANQGVDWVLLTNGVTWRAYKVGFGKPITHELVLELHLMDLNPRSEDHIEQLFLLSKEGWQKSRLLEHHSQREALSRFTIGALLLSDSVVDMLRRELRRISPNVRVDSEDVRDVLLNEVLKREVFEGDRASAARKLVARAANRPLRGGRVVEAPAVPVSPPVVEPKATAGPQPRS